jgi:Big-like domain-containing protein
MDSRPEELRSGQRLMGLPLSVVILGMLAAPSASGQVAWGAEVVVTETARPGVHTFRYRVINMGSAPGVSFELGFDCDEGDAFLKSEPLAIRSPQGWSAVVEGAEGMQGFLIQWEATNLDNPEQPIPAKGELSGFEVDVAIADPLYRTTRATVAFNDAQHDVVSVHPPGLPTDLTPPKVTVTKPSAGAQLRESVVVSANASDDVGVFDVRFRMNGAEFATADDRGAEPGTHEISWDTVMVPNGSYSLTAVARDSAGNETVSVPVAVTVVNDTTRPSVTFSNPAPGATVRATVTLSASTNGPHPVTAVFYYLDGRHIGSAASAPFALPWDTASVVNGTHELKALAFDRSGRYGKVTIPVTVSN